MKKILFFLMCLCCSMMFFACGQGDSESTGTGDSAQIEQESDDTSNGSNDSSDSNNGSDGVWTPPSVIG